MLGSIFGFKYQQYMHLDNTVGTLSSSQNMSKMGRIKSRVSQKQPYLAKINSDSKLDKRPSGRQNDSDQLAIQKAFRIHSRNHIYQEQALFSLKLLGYKMTPDQHSKFQKIWKKYNNQVIDQSMFKELFRQIKGKGSMMNNKQAFDIITQGEACLSLQRLRAIGVQLKIDISKIAGLFKQEGGMNYQQFDTYLKYSNVISL